MHRLKSLVDNLSGADQIYIWIDTICVPMNGAARKTAIKKLKETYENAEKSSRSGVVRSTHLRRLQSLEQPTGCVNSL